MVKNLIKKGGFIAGLIMVALIAMPSIASAKQMNIVDTAKKAGFTRLVKALEFTGLDKTLEGKGPFTVFAPTNKAFEVFDKAHPGMLDDLMKTKEGTEKIKAILLYHVVDGKVMAKQVKAMTENKAMNGDLLKVKVEGKKVMINDATVKKADVKASNGVIHVIDKVLVPADKVAVSADKAAVSADKAEVSAGKAAVSADKAAVSADKAAVLADKAAVPDITK